MSHVHICNNTQCNLSSLRRCKAKLKYLSKRNVSRAEGIPSSGDSGHQGTESLLHGILVGIPSSGDSVQWGFRPVGIPGTKERNHHCMKFWWGFRPVGIPSSGDSVQ